MCTQYHWRALILRHRLQSVRSFMFAHIFCPIWRTLAVASRAGHASMCPSRTHAGRAAAAAFYLSICCRRAVPTCFVESRCQPSFAPLTRLCRCVFDRRGFVVEEYKRRVCLQMCADRSTENMSKLTQKTQNDLKHTTHLPNHRMDS